MDDRNDAGITITDERPVGWARIGFDFIDDTRITKKAVICTYIALARFAGFKHGATNVRRRMIARRARIGNMRTLDACLRQLIALGWLRVAFKPTLGHPVAYALTLPVCKGYKPMPKQDW